VVLDVELEQAWQRAREQTQPQSTRQRRAAALRLAEITVARVSDLGANDRTERALSHLGNVLKACRRLPAPTSRSCLRRAAFTFAASEGG